MAFWESKTGQPLTGKLEDAITPDFEVIPHGTLARATIKDFKHVNKTFEDQVREYYEITWKIVDGDFKNRIVSQKIKAFDNKPEIVQRALNMMKLVYDIFGHKPTHNDAPTDEDHKVFLGKMAGIKIGEWQMPKRDGSGFMEGNNVIEVHKLDGTFKPEIGVKRELPVVQTSAVDSAFNRNQLNLGDDLPF